MLTLGDMSGELEAAVPHVLQYGVMPNQAQLLEAGRPDLAQAVRVGFQLQPLRNLSNSAVHALSASARDCLWQLNFLGTCAASQAPRQLLMQLCQCRA